ncbi:MAG: hypothetical protein JO227_24655 [Acetobacteraceae bacterium]|nr:hypothetical protein [Acetobacteraceae bacterium]
MTTNNLLNFPLAVFVMSLFVLWLSAQVGAFFRKRTRQLEEDEEHDLGVVVAASLTLLGLIIGFSFSMAIGRYDERKHYEEEEANAIGTEYLRADLLPGADAANVRELLRSYLDQRILFYTTREVHRQEQINTDTAQLQANLWSAVRAPAVSQPSPVVALAVAGMNDVLNSQGYTQAAWWNRIPTPAWLLMAAIAISCNVLHGFNARRVTPGIRRFFALPFLVSISFFLIADIDSPRRGLIRVVPQNLLQVAQSIHTP